MRLPKAGRGVQLHCAQTDGGQVRCMVEHPQLVRVGARHGQGIPPYCSLELVNAFLEQTGLPKLLGAAWIRRWRPMMSIGVQRRTLQPLEIKRTRSLLQGEQSAPLLLCATLDLVLASFSDVCIRACWGFDGAVGLHALVCADNAWLVATDPSTLETVYRTWQRLLRKDGCDTSTSGCAWRCAARGDSLAGWCTSGASRGRCCRRRTGLMGTQVLGTWTTFDSNDKKGVRARRRRDWEMSLTERRVRCHLQKLCHQTTLGG